MSLREENSLVMWAWLHALHLWCPHLWNLVGESQVLLEAGSLEKRLGDTKALIVGALLATYFMEMSNIDLIFSAEERSGKYFFTISITWLYCRLYVFEKIRPYRNHFGEHLLYWITFILLFFFIRNKKSNSAIVFGGILSWHPLWWMKLFLFYRLFWLFWYQSFLIPKIITKIITK